MSQIPETPGEFFSTFIPQRFAALPASVHSALAGKSSPGALVCRVEGNCGGVWSLRLEGGKVAVSREVPEDTLLQITISTEDFVPILIEGARAYEAANPDLSKQTLERQLIAFKALAIDAERAKLIRAIPGSMVFAIKDGETVRRLALTPGGKPPRLEKPECRVDCMIGDFRDMQAGKVQPMQLFMQQKMKMIGNAQIPMALSTVFVLRGYHPRPLLAPNPRGPPHPAAHAALGAPCPVSDLRAPLACRHCDLLTSCIVFLHRCSSSSRESRVGA
ncbi:MAG: SCP2 sterol-binding domain-containing protein [Myxococcales bacterium]|nr:SCP2 sterol-binding domain-containing protein [Polyangiaceae bacterium]MDW8250986.1 SCP2 sterol-binding domain-containing protein [Myxococcales bacterium]